MSHPDGFSERVPPMDLKAEQSVLGAMLVEPNVVIPLIQPLLRPTDFYAEKHQKLYGSIFSVAARGEPVDLTTVQSELGRQPSTVDSGTLLDEVGGFGYLMTLINVVPTTANVEQYARIVEGKATLRRLQQACRKVIDDAYTAEDASMAVAQGEAALQRITMGRGATVKAETFEDLPEWLTEYVSTPDTGRLPTGLDALDDVLVIRRKQVHAIAGPAKMGKSTLLRQIARNMADDGLHVLYMSLEENKEDQRLAFISTESGVPADDIGRKLVKPGVKGDTWDRVRMAAHTLKQLPIRFDFTKGPNVSQVCAKIRYHALTWGLDMVLLDTQNAMASDKRKDERSDEMLTRWVRELEVAVTAANCGLLAAIQGKQDIMSRDNIFMTPMDLSDSRGQIQAWWSVIGLLRPDKFQNEKAYLNYGGAKLFAKDARWNGVMALFTVAARKAPENMIIPVYSSMTTGKVSNLARDYWPWRADKEQAPPPTAIIPRRKHAAAPPTEQRRLWDPEPKDEF